MKPVTRSATEKLAIVKRILEARAAGRETESACRAEGIHQATFYRWLARLKQAEDSHTAALSPKSRRPKTLARLTPQSLRHEVISLARGGSFQSANQITEALRRSGHRTTCSTVINILEEEGLFGIIEKKDRKGNVVGKKRGLVLR